MDFLLSKYGLIFTEFDSIDWGGDSAPPMVVGEKHRLYNNNNYML